MSQIMLVIHEQKIFGAWMGVSFHFDAATGAVAYSEFEENIRQNIMVIIGTRPGERQMLYDFGCRIHELMFAPAIGNCSHLASQYVHEALGRWESQD